MPLPCLAFRLEKASMISLKSMESMSSDSIAINARDDSLSWFKLVLSLFFTLARVKKDRFPSQFVTGIVNKRCRAIYTFGNVDISPSLSLAIVFKRSTGAISRSRTKTLSCVSSFFMLALTSSGYWILCNQAVCMSLR